MNPVVDFIGDAKFAQILDQHPKRVGYAFRDAVNDTVEDIGIYAQKHFTDNFTERNKFSLSGIKPWKFFKKPILENIEAAVGAYKNRPWLAEQEKGFTSDGAQATKAMRVSGSYKRAVRKKNYLKGVSVRRASLVPNKAKTKRGKTMAMLAISFRNGYGLKGSSDFFQFDEGELFSSMESGLYQFDGNAKVGGLDYPGIKLAYRLDNRRTVKATPWLMEAVEKQGNTRLILKRFEEQLEEQMRQFK